MKDPSKDNINIEKNVHESVHDNDKLHKSVEYWEKACHEYIDIIPTS